MRNVERCIRIGSEVDLPKGGVYIGEHVLFGKYRLCRRLGKGRSGTVYLAYHRELEEYRAVKVVPKSMADYDEFRKEALFLKTLRHPGIPLVYDVEEDGENSYLIEEYLEGESLYALVKRLGGLSVNAALDIGIQICRIIEFMNSAEKPILYLDLQPGNLMVCGDGIRLIDFDHARYAGEEDCGGRYGTAGFAAPEQYGGEPLDCRTDVYAIGALLYFMRYGHPPRERTEGRFEVPETCCRKGAGYREDAASVLHEAAAESRKLDRIMDGCMAADRNRRYQSAGELADTLEELRKESSEKQAINSLNIIFAGARPGLGTTHAALGLSTFLTRNGFPTLYQEEYDTGTVRALANGRGLKADRRGVFRIGALRLRPYYGEAVRLPYLYYPIVIKDTGASWTQNRRLPEADFCVLVCGGKCWETGNTLAAARSLAGQGRLVLLFNHLSAEARFRLPEELSGAPYLRLPFFSDPFRTGPATDACFRKLMDYGTGGRTNWQRKRRGILPGRRKAD